MTLGSARSGTAVVRGWVRFTRGWAAWSCLAIAGWAAGPTNLVQLRGLLTESLGQLKAPGATWGVQVVNLSNGAVVYGANSDRLFVPASCTKLFTTALALERLGPGFRVVTPLRAVGTVDAEGKLHGDLVWEGRGATDLGERRSGSTAAALAPYVEAVVRAGIRQVEGTVVADESWFRTTPYGPGWNWDDLVEAYGAGVSSLSFNDNLAHIRVQPGAEGQPVGIVAAPFPDVFRIVNRTRTGPANVPLHLRFERSPGSVELLVSGTFPLGHGPYEENLAVPEPALTAGRALRDALIQRGISVRQPARVLTWRDRSTAGASGKWLGAVTSAPLTELVRDCLKPSQNLHAQLLLLQVGADVENHSRPGETAGETTDDSALAALEQFLKSLGVSRSEFSWEEGSGLSRKNVVTPAATVRLLRHMAGHANPAIRAAWREALPIAGVDGTLKNRFTREPARGNLRAKTGSLRQIHAIAGYLDTLGGDHLALAIYLNGFVPADPRTSGRAEIDRVAEILAAYPGRL